MIVLGRRRRGQAPPPHIVWDALRAPDDDGGRPWLVLTDAEVKPTIVDGVRPDYLVWSSIFSARPNDRIRFDLLSDGMSGCALTWTLLTPGGEPDAEELRQMRYRLNFLINGALRAHFDL